MNRRIVVSLLMGMLLLIVLIMYHQRFITDSPIAQAQVVPISLPGAPITLQNAQTGNATGTLLDTNGGMTAAVQVVSAGGWNGTLNFEISLDTDNYVATLCFPSTTGIPATTTTADGVYFCTIGGSLKFRVRTSNTTSGNVTVTANVMPAPMWGNTGSASALTYDTNGYAQVTLGTGLKSGVDSVDVTSTVAHDAADAGNPIKVGGRYTGNRQENLAQDDRSDLLTDKRGNLKNMDAVYETVAQITSSGNNQVVTNNPVYLSHVVINNAAGAGGNFGLYDKGSGTCTSGGTTIFPAVDTVNAPATVWVKRRLSNGICVNNTAGTLGTATLTFIYQVNTN